MNHPGQNIITEVSTEVPAKTGFSIYAIIGIVVLFTIFASVVSYSKHLFVAPAWLTKLPGVSSLFSGASRTEDPAGDMPNGGPAPVTYPNGGDKIPESSNVSNDSAEQAWCLVGEDMAGRWCVEVPNVKACDTDRTFKSKNACEGGM